MRVNRDSPLPLSLQSYHRMRLEQSRYRVEQDAYNDGTAIGFFLGVLGAGLAWAILSGALIELLLVLVRAARALGGGA